MKQEAGDWQVIRDCCTSGLCIECAKSKDRPKRIVHADGYSEAYAVYVAERWKAYRARVERMNAVW